MGGPQVQTPDELRQAEQGTPVRKLNNTKRVLLHVLFTHGS